jgi:predicted enzyme related to lactoylglutathione lyase
VSDSSKIAGPRSDPARVRSDTPRLVAVGDVARSAAASLAEELVAFYVDVLGLTRLALAEPAVIAFRGEQVTGPRLLVRLMEKPPEPDVIPMMIQVASLSEVAEELAGRGTEVLWSQGMWYYERRLLVQDPAGNWLSLTASHPL